MHQLDWFAITICKYTLVLCSLYLSGESLFVAGRLKLIISYARPKRTVVLTIK